MPSKRVLKKYLGDGMASLGDEPLVLRGAVVTKTGLSVQEFAGGVVRHTRLTFANVSVATTDNTTAGANGPQKIYDFPVGRVTIVASGMDLTIARVGTGLSATSAVVASLGSAAAANDNGALSSTEADVIASVAATLSSGAGVAVGSGVGVTFATGADLYLNFATPDAGTSGNDALLVNGFVDVFWIQVTD